MTIEQRRLSLHPLAIHTFIQAQAGSLAKALSESVMNSFDAFASAVQVEITADGFVVSDDGQGFRDKDEISAWFETLGFPHDEGNHRTWGKFGMGRAQAWAFASTVWTSNFFQMSVDVKKMGLDYELKTLPSPVKGTSIVGKLYSPMSAADHARVEQELRELVKYVPGAVLLNGRVINKDPALEEWTQETPDAWMKLESSRTGSLSVYNAGILVTRYSHWTYGCTGIIVTKPDRVLTLNLARNSILEAECKVWKRIKASLPAAIERKSAPKKVKATKLQVDALLAEVRSGEKSLMKALEDAPELLIDVGGRALDVYKLFRASTPVLFVPKGDEAGKRLNKTKQALVVAKESLGFLSMTMQELRAIVFKEALDRGHRNINGVRVWSDAPTEVFPEFFAGQVQYVIAELTPRQKAGTLAWHRTWSGMLATLQSVAPSLELKETTRKMSCFVTGDSPTGTAWLTSNGSTVVFRLKELEVNMAKSYDRLSKYAMQQVRCVCRLAAGDDYVGDQFFLKAITETSLVGQLIPELVRRYSACCREYDLELDKTQLCNLDVACAA